ncbi:hypothetical protein GGR52DRAFT_588666 [Hypoxylon sp. FL1284]|nr:hypothetical protein GGR52DRAFT_588666 [Hypoxylon sp. FL1284]
MTSTNAVNPSGGSFPYPNLIDEYARRNQQAFFREPVGKRSTNQLVQADKTSMDVFVKKHAPAFGSLSPVYKGQKEITFFREDRGTVYHGLGRPDEDAYECAKFSMLRHPHPYDYNNPDYTGDSGPVTGLDKERLKIAVNYPRIPGTVLNAPMLPSREATTHVNEAKDGHFYHPKAQQPSALSRVFLTMELCQKVMLEVGAHWGDLANLTSTCQMIMYAIADASSRVDLTVGNFMNLDWSHEQIAEVRGKMTEEEKKHGIPISVPSTFVVFSNIRGRFIEDTTVPNPPSEYGFPARPNGTYNVAPRTAAARLTDTYKLLRTAHVRGDQLKFLHFHSMKYLDLHTLRKCLVEMPNLEVLGVYNCELINFQSTIKLMHVVIKHNKRPGYKHLEADFSPYYYTGPHRGSQSYKGEYGVIPYDVGTVDTRRAMTVVLLKAVRLARKHGIDWFSPGTAFRQFLERVPFALGTIRYILEAIYNLVNFEEGITGPTVESLMEAGVRSETARELVVLMSRTVWSDIILAVEGTSMDSKALRALMMHGRRFHLTKCAFCDIELPAYFYTAESMNRHQDQIQCCGCQLNSVLERNIHDFHQQKKKALQVMFNDHRFTDLKAYLYGKRRATDAEIRNPDFPFWDLAAVQMSHFLDERREATAGGPPDTFVLGDRPNVHHPDKTKEVNVWKERLWEAMDHTTDQIEGGRERIRQELRECQARIQLMDKQYDSGRCGTLEVRQNRDTVEALYRYADQLRTEAGYGQLGGKYGAIAAASWDAEVEKYRQLVQAKTGVLQTNGSHGPVLW